MPLYVYQCKKCKEKLEVLQKISDSSLPECPKKEGEEHQMERVIAGSSTFVLKGSGWYKDGY